MIGENQKEQKSVRKITWKEVLLLLVCHYKTHRPI